MTRARWSGIGLGLALLACAEPEPAFDRTPELVAAIDLDPDPDVVEVELVAARGAVELLDGVTTEVWGFRDAGDPSAGVTIPGPLIRAEVGDRLIVRFRNELDEATTVHWHGLRLPVEMDGNPMVSGLVEPGEQFVYDFVLRDAGTFWYHPHVDVDEQVERGLHGELLVVDPEDPAVSVDRVLEIDDVELDAAGQIVIEPSELDVALGRIGNVLLVNGAPPAAVEVAAGASERWRLVNAANGRHLRVALRERGASEHRPLTVIGWDGGLTAAAYDVDDLPIAPGERYELLLAIPDEPGARLVLETLPVDRGDGREDAGPFDLVELRIGPARPGEPRPSPAAFARALAPIPVDAGTLERSFELRSTEAPETGRVFFINDERWPLNTPVEVELGATEIWLVDNQSPGWHPFHIHGLFFEILDINGVPPPVLGAKDTVAIPGQSVARLAVRYGDPGMWMFHCTIPEHAERGMMGDLLVAPP